MLHRWGIAMVRLRWWVVGAWLVVFAACLLAAPRVTSALRSGFGEVDTESRVALKLMADRLGLRESSVTLVFSHDSLRAADAAYAARVESAVAPLRDMDGVEGIVTFYTSGNPHMVAPDDRTSYALVLLSSSIDDSVEMFPAIRERLRPGDLRVWATGGVAIFSDLDRASEDDLRRAELITLPVVLIALVIVFGSVVAAGLPVAMGGLSIVVTLALVYLLAQQVDMSIFVLNIASFLGLGMAIDYALIMVSRFREELARRDVEAAVAVTCDRAGRAVLFSALTSALGLSGLLFFDFMMLRSLGVGGATVILMSMLIALTLIPALLGILGHRVNALTVVPRRSGPNVWHGLSRWVMRHPVAVIVPVTISLLLLGAPFLGVKLGSPWASILPAGAESREGWELVEERFGPGELAPIVVVTTSETGVFQPGNVAAAHEFVQRMSADPRVGRVESIVSLAPGVSLEQYQALYSSPELPARAPGEAARAVRELSGGSGDMAIIRVFPSHAPVSDETKALVRDIRAAPPGGDLQTFVTGVTADLMDTVSRMYSDFPKVIVYVVVTTYLALFWLFRSVVLPLKAVVMNGLSILASYGALVVIFQRGFLQGVLGFQAEGFTEASVPILLFCIVFGLSMDYEVFLLSRVKEEYEASGDNTSSVAVGMERSAAIITSAALILILVSAAFATSDILIVKALGFGTALAIFVDATIVRALLAPAIMRVLSRLNWWAPAFLGGAYNPQDDAKA